MAQFFTIYGVDLLVILSWTLSANSPTDDITVMYVKPTGNQSDKYSVSHTTAHIINDLINEEIDRQSTTRRNDPISFDVDGKLENINPLLLDFVNSNTATVREGKHPTLGGRDINTLKSENIQFAEHVTVLYKS